MRLLRKNYGHPLFFWKIFVAGGDKPRKFYSAFIKIFNYRELSFRRKQYKNIEFSDFEKFPRNEGYIFYSADSLPESGREVVEKAKEIYEKKLTQPYEKGKGWFRESHPIAPSQTDENSPFIHFALNGYILKLISEYFETIPVLHYISVDRCVWTEGPPKGNQLFHCDSADTKQIKIFINCNYIGIENGPFSLLAADSSKYVRRRISYKYGRGGMTGKGKRADEEIYDLVDHKQIHKLIGGPGTWALADTSNCFHHGPRFEKGADPRLTVMFQYKNPKGIGLSPWGDDDENFPYRKLVSREFNSLQNAVLGGYRHFPE